MCKHVKKRQSGFTLIEVMVVLAILGVMAAMILPNVIGKDDQARVTATKSSLSSVANALEMYKLDNYRYPTTEEGLEALAKRPASARIFPDGGYLRKVPVDSWDRPFQYASPSSSGRPFDLYSLGADGAEGGEGFAADIFFE
jgi:general secretion pathway protein G